MMSLSLLSCLLILLNLWSIPVNSTASSSSSKPATDSSVEIAAYYYPWYDGNDNFHWDQGFLRSKLEIPQRPFLGRYTLEDPATVDQHLEWANEYGISQFICSWWGPQNANDYVLLHNLLRSPKLGRNFKIALLYESLGLLDIFKAEDGSLHFDEQGKAYRTLLSHVEYMAQQYFSHPNYLKVHGGKPVVYFYVTRIFQGAYRQAFAKLRLTIQQDYGVDLYLVGDEVFWEGPDPSRITVWDAVTAYNMHGPPRYAGYPAVTNLFQDIENMYTQYQVVANAHNVTLLPGISPAFNDRGVRLEANHYPIPHEVRAELAGTGQYTTFWEGLQMAKRVLDNQQEVADAPCTIVVTSFNEWHEDSAIEPTVRYVPPSKKPDLLTMGYTYEAYGFRLLGMVQRFLNETNNNREHGHDDEEKNTPSMQQQASGSLTSTV
ncbi:Glycoprotein endo-alpha-1,2-mannosidase-like protein [Seminavis robusta]|uniref:Glycoprotein endo-alpha-1,2-mannosidase-like protein n=1 Tax=Seminavis robusta TaxID=568900 RepID=A0A9N8DD62_9STRA|nr:Glycoprotein endo-alpha-1,2-mannosidase-like protein [Seminavis robusta]|eukprot:Sro65_g036710.1 Glycoprotein endo-alpha-1,2-mannosidase-like protein (433) ;mRNA; f:56833-58131